MLREHGLRFSSWMTPWHWLRVIGHVGCAGEMTTSPTAMPSPTHGNPPGPFWLQISINVLGWNAIDVVVGWCVLKTEFSPQEK